MIGRILLSLAAFALAGFLLLVLIGLWDGYEQETKALGFSGIYERYRPAFSPPVIYIFGSGARPGWEWKLVSLEVSKVVRMRVGRS
jgi:hypothetical protein